MEKRLSLHKLLQESKLAFRSPTAKQKEAYGRLAHTLCAASLVGSVSVMFTETTASLYAFFKVAALLFWAVLLFWIGALASKGE